MITSAARPPAQSHLARYILPDRVELLVFASAATARAAGWDAVAGVPVWLRSAWLAAFASRRQGGAGGPETYYLLFRSAGGHPLGQALLQRLPIRAMRLGPQLASAWVGALLGADAWQFGQVLFSGPSGQHFVDGADALALLTAAREALVEQASGTPWGAGGAAPTRNRTVPAGTWLIKDLPHDTPTSSHADSWWPLEALPELAIEIPAAWESFEDYLAALPSKYRTRMRRARGKFAGLTVRAIAVDDLLAEDLMSTHPQQARLHSPRSVPSAVAVAPASGGLSPKQPPGAALPAATRSTEPTAGARVSTSATAPESTRKSAEPREPRADRPDVDADPLTGQTKARLVDGLDRLYAALLERAEHVPFRVEAGYVARVKVLRPDAVQLRGYFDGEKLIGFSTLLLDDAEALAHLAACDPAYNHTHQLYLNMLADLLAAAIEDGARSLNYGRTATTIKSSLGALPKTYASFVGHDGCVRHHALGTLAKRSTGGVEAADALVQRPFK